MVPPGAFRGLAQWVGDWAKVFLGVLVGLSLCSPASSLATKPAIGSSPLVNLSFGKSPVGSSLVIMAPVPGSMLPGSSVTFEWGAGSRVETYQLWVGTTPGSNNLGLCRVRTTSCQLTGLPTNGSTIYATLLWEISGRWQEGTPIAFTAATTAASLSGLSCASGSITGAGTDICTVTLNAAAASSGFAVALSSSNTAVAVPSSVTVPSGSASASFTATISSVSTAQAATLTASAGGVAKTFALQLEASVPTLSVSAGTLSFGSVNVNTEATQSLTLTSTGTAAVTVNAATVLGLGFTVSGATFPLTLSANQTATLSVKFAPTAAGAVAGSLTLTSNSSTGSSTAVSLSGTGEPVMSGFTCTSSSVTGAGTDNCTVTLNTAAASGGVAIALASNNSAVIVPATVTVPTGLASASFTATISSVSTAQTATLTANANGVAQTFALQLGAAAPALSINATSIPFGDVMVNSPATQSVTLTSTGGAPVTVNSAAVTGTGFSVSGATFPLTLNPNQTATLSVGFDPNCAGAASGSLTITSNSSTGSSEVVALSGTGVTGSYEVDLTWNAPAASTDSVVGYNVYRAPSGSSAYIQLNSSVITETSYIDVTASSGRTYSYIIESIDGTGVASVPSNVASVSVH